MKDQILKNKAMYEQQRDDSNRKAVALEEAARKLRLDAIAAGGAVQACDQLLTLLCEAPEPSSPADSPPS